MVSAGAQLARPLARLRASCLACALGALVGCSGSGQFTLQRRQALFIQPPAMEERLVGEGFYSHENESASHNSAHADDFMLETPSRVSGVRWWGVVDGAGGGADLSNIEAYTVSIHRSTPEGAPGRLIHSERFALAATDPQPTGRSTPAGATPGEPAMEHAHLARFDKPLNLAGGAVHWLSVRAHLKDPEGDNWRWQDAGASGGVSYSMPLETGAWVSVEARNSAFVIVGWRNEIPQGFEEIR